jgi:hypothetical protein
VTVCRAEYSAGAQMEAPAVSIATPIAVAVLNEAAHPGRWPGTSERGIAPNIIPRGYAFLVICATAIAGSLPRPAVAFCRRSYRLSARSVVTDG